MVMVWGETFADDISRTVIRSAFEGNLIPTLQNAGIKMWFLCKVRAEIGVFLDGSPARRPPVAGQFIQSNNGNGEQALIWAATRSR